MMRSLILLTFFMSSMGLSAQMYELGVFAGGANMIGDVGRTNYIRPSNVAFGGLFLQYLY